MMIDLAGVVAGETRAMQVIGGTAEELWEALATLGDGGPVCRFIRAERAATLPLLYDELAAAFQYPPHFGANKGAYEDVMRDLSWLRPDAGVVMGIADAEWLLAGDDFEALIWFIEVSFRLAKYWAEQSPPGVPGPFRVVMQTSDPTGLATMVDQWVETELPHVTW